MRVLDLFSAAAGGWSLGMHRAGFTTIAACEVEEWRRVLYSENNPGVPVYDNVCTLTGARLLADLGTLPSVIVGSPPCQDISSANPKGQGVDGARSGLYFEAVRLVRECRPRWCAFENSANLRTKGADRILGEFEALGYSVEAVVVGGDDIGANHERKRSWLIGFDIAQVADPDAIRWDDEWRRRRSGFDLSVPHDPEHAAGDGWAAGRARGRAVSASGLPLETCGDDAHAVEVGPEGLARRYLERPGKIAERPDIFARREMGLRALDRGQAFGCRADWTLGDLADHLRMDDGLSAWLARTRVAVGGPRGTAAASLIVEAFGDAVLPQIPEAIGRAILRTEAALSAIYRRAA